tara:strand:- start:13177 stop:14103 length:927 start_codon:yes stop_codon:yes gene_type:complete
MSKQTLNRIMKVFIGATLIWVLLSLLNNQDQDSKSVSNRIKEVFTDFDSTTVKTLKITSPDGGITELTYLTDTWEVNGYASEEASLRKLWDAIDEDNVGNVVANNAENHRRMGLSLDSTWVLEIINVDNQQSTILVGNSGPTFPSVFTRLVDQNEVVVISGELRSAVTQSLTEWRDKTITTTDTAAVKSILLDYGDETYRLERSDTTWVMNGETLDLAAMIGITAELSNMEASGFLDESQTPSDLNRRRIVAMDESGKLLNQLILSGEGTTRHVQSLNSEVIFEVPSWKFSRIVPEIFMLIQDNPSGC